MPTPLVGSVSRPTLKGVVSYVYLVCVGYVSGAIYLTSESESESSSTVSTPAQSGSSRLPPVLGSVGLSLLTSVAVSVVLSLTSDSFLMALILAPISAQAWPVTTLTAWWTAFNTPGVRLRVGVFCAP